MECRKLWMLISFLIMVWFPVLKMSFFSILRQVYLDGDEVHLKPTHHQFKTLVLQKDTQHRFLGVVIETKNTNSNNPKVLNKVLIFMILMVYIKLIKN